MRFHFDAFFFQLHTYAVSTHSRPQVAAELREALAGAVGNLAQGHFSSKRCAAHVIKFSNPDFTLPVQDSSLEQRFLLKSF